MLLLIIRDYIIKLHIKLIFFFFYRSKYIILAMLSNKYDKYTKNCAM